MSVQDVVNQHYEGFNQNSYQANAKSYIDPNVVYLDVPTGQEARGLEGYIQYANGWRGAFSNANVHVVDQKVQGNTVVTTFRGRGTFDGQFPTPQGMIPGTGRDIDVEFKETATVNGDKITNLRLEYDPQELMRQLGIG